MHTVESYTIASPSKTFAEQITGFLQTSLHQFIYTSLVLPQNLVMVGLPNVSHSGPGPIRVAYLEGYFMSSNCQVSDYTCKDASYSFILMAMVSKLLKLDIEYVTWTEGGWEGISDFLLNGSADMSIPYMSLHQSRIDKVDLLSVILRTGSAKFVFHYNSLKEKVVFHWEAVLPNTLWCLLVVSSLLRYLLLIGAA